MPWLWVVLLPFIEEDRLLTEIRQLETTFTAEERARNCRVGEALLFLHKGHPLFPMAEGVHRWQMQKKELREAAAGGDSDGGDSGGGSDGGGDGDALSGKLAKAEAKAGGGQLVAAGGGENDDRKRLVLDAEDPAAEGFSGSLGPRSDAIDVNACLVAPLIPANKFHDTLHNQSLRVTYELPPVRPHLCGPLPGAEEPPKILSPQDIAQLNSSNQKGAPPGMERESRRKRAVRREQGRPARYGEREPSEESR
jgi:hypothetical protein